MRATRSEGRRSKQRRQTSRQYGGSVASAGSSSGGRLPAACYRAATGLSFTPGPQQLFAERAAFAAFAAAKAGLRMVSQSIAREFGPRGIHVAHVIIDGSIEGDKIVSKIPDIGQQKGPDGLLHPDVIELLVSTLATSFCLVAGARCASICRNLLNLGRPISSQAGPFSSHRSRRDIFGLGLSSMTLFVFFGPSVS